MPRLNFLPARDGWHFANLFETHILPDVFNVTTHGLCGGMTMTALDYWRAGVPIPGHIAGDFPADRNKNNVPEESSNLRRYIYDRQIHSLTTRLMFTRWITTLNANQFHDAATGPEFEVVKQQISLNRPVMLGLWSMTDGPLGGHQVLCYGWDINPLRLYLYDPNFPDEETVLTPESAAKGCRVFATLSKQEKYYRGYFFTDVYNWTENPPYDPRYRDIVVTSGITLNPKGPDINVKTPLSLSVTVQNIGEYPSRFQSLNIWARDPAGNDLDAVVGGVEPGCSVLNPKQSHTINRHVAAFGTVAGAHTIGLSKLSLRGYFQSVPAGNAGTVSTRVLKLWPSKNELPAKWVSVKESNSTDQDSGVVLHPGDEFALTGAGAIWAGVIFTGNNGPEGWTDRIETNPKSPLHNTADSRPFSLLGRFEGEGYFYIGHGLTRRTFNRSSPRRLFLRINDNTPGNGSGAFQCHVQVWR